MKIIFTGGGTAGHINPALAIANYVREKNPDWKLAFLGNPDHMEYRLATNSGYDFIGIKLKGFQRKLNIRNIKNNIIALGLLAVSDVKCKKIIKNFKPDLIIGTGGYVTGPIIHTASNLGVKTITHEQNAFPGLTTKLLASKVDAVLLANPDAKRFFNKNSNVIITGNPIRNEILTIDRNKARKSLGIKDNDFCILSFGGSLGAKVISSTISKLILKTYKIPNIFHIHATGKYEKDSFFNTLKKNNLNYLDHPNLDIRVFIDNMPTCLSAADLVISRSGALTISEIEAAGRASILIPSPNVSANHQYYNAKTLYDKNAAILIEEKNLSIDLLYSTVMSLINNRAQISNMEKMAKKLAITNSCEKIYDVILNLVKN